MSESQARERAKLPLLIVLIILALGAGSGLFWHFRNKHRLGVDIPPVPKEETAGERDGPMGPGGVSAFPPVVAHGRDSSVSEETGVPGQGLRQDTGQGPGMEAHSRAALKPTSAEAGHDAAFEGEPNAPEARKIVPDDASRITDVDADESGRKAGGQIMPDQTGADGRGPVFVTPHPLPGLLTSDILVPGEALPLLRSPDGASGREQSPKAGTGNTATPKNAGLPTMARQAGKNDASGATEGAGSGGPTPVILYGRGVPVNPQGNVVRGEIPEGQNPEQARIRPGGQDSLVGPELIGGLARFLAENYWPEGTHPMARNRGFSTAGVKWANVRFGSQLQGFDVDHDNPERERKRILQYVFVPSMIQGLYELYNDRFFSSLETEAMAQKRGPDQKPFTPLQTADMFETYADMARALAGTVRAYKDTPGIRKLTVEYAQAQTKASASHARYVSWRGETLSEADGGLRAEANAGADPAPSSQVAILAGKERARVYREAVMDRERKREELAAALRRKETTRGLDSESLVYTSLWLLRRDKFNPAALSSIADILDSGAERMAKLRDSYRNKALRRQSAVPENGIGSGSQTGAGQKGTE